MQPTPIVSAEPPRRYTVRPNAAERSYDVLDGATLVAFYPMTAAGYQQAYEACNDLNYRDAEESALAVADEDAELAAQHEDYLASLRQSGNVTRGPLVAHPSLLEQGHIVNGILRVDWTGRPAGEAGVVADYLVRGAR